MTVLRKLLTEAKSKDLKWCLQVEGINHYPNNYDDDLSFENLKFTNNINETIKENNKYLVDSDIIFEEGSWIKIINQGSPNNPENISDWLDTKSLSWLDDFQDKLIEEYDSYL